MEHEEFRNYLKSEFDLTPMEVHDIMMATIQYAHTYASELINCTLKGDTDNG